MLLVLSPDQPGAKASITRHPLFSLVKRVMETVYVQLLGKYKGDREFCCIISNCLRFLHILLSLNVFPSLIPAK